MENHPLNRFYQRVNRKFTTDFQIVNLTAQYWSYRRKNVLQ